MIIATIVFSFICYVLKGIYVFLQTVDIAIHKRYNGCIVSNINIKRKRNLLWHIST